MVFIGWWGINGFFWFCKVMCIWCWCRLWVVCFVFLCCVFCLMGNVMWFVLSGWKISWVIVLTLVVKWSFRMLLVGCWGRKGKEFVWFWKWVGWCVLIVFWVVMLWCVVYFCWWFIMYINVMFLVIYWFNSFLCVMF